MNLLVQNIWDTPKGWWVVIPTCTEVNSVGSLVMGRGLARQAADRFTHLPLTWSDEPYKVRADVPSRCIRFPTKASWRQPSTLDRVRRSLEELKKLDVMLKEEPVALPFVGCGEGGLRWRDVGPVVDAIVGKCKNVTLVATPETMAALWR